MLATSSRQLSLVVSNFLGVVKAFVSHGSFADFDVCGRSVFNIMSRRFRSAFTLVELMVVISIIGVLAGLLIPAIQATRQAARRMQCQSNLKQLGLASMNFESAYRHLPGPTMNAHPKTTSYLSDVGLFVNMLPYFEQNALYESINKNVPSNSVPNKSRIEKSPSLLKCPSTLDSELLVNLSDRFSGPSVAGLQAQACDYSGNDGAYIAGKAHFGTIRLRVGSVVKERRLAEVTDGTSNTFLFWESAGDRISFSRKVSFPMNEGASATFTYLIDMNPSSALLSTTRASTKSYLYSWSGFRIGTVVGGAINESNQIGEPFGEHPGIVNFAFTDGSVRSLSESVDSAVVVALATAQNHDVAFGD